MRQEVKYKNYHAVMGFRPEYINSFVPSHENEKLYDTVKDHLFLPKDDWFSIFKNEKLIMFGGNTKWWDGRCSLWTVYGADLSVRDWAFIYSVTDDYIKFLRSNGFWRIEASAKTTKLEYCKFLDRLGFNKEGLMRNYSPFREDCYLYSMVYP